MAQPYVKFHDWGQSLLLGKAQLHTAGNSVCRIYLSNVATPSQALSAKTAVAEIATGSGYGATPLDISNDVAEATGTAGLWYVTAASTGLKWTATATGSFGPFQTVVCYDDYQTAPADQLIAYWQNGSALTISNGASYEVTFTNNRLFTLNSVS